MIRFSHGVDTSVGRVRRVNEDSYLAVPPIYAVADGMGGHGSGDLASRLAVETLARCVMLRPLFTEAVLHALEEANQVIVSRAEPPSRMGTTVTGLAGLETAGGDQLMVFNVGDSRVYRLAAERIVQLTIDHSEVQELVLAGVLTREQARTHPRRNIVTRALGSAPTAAFQAPYQLDARRCISYLTIEHKGMIPVELRAAIGNRIFGCDDCLAVCPWNKFAAAAREMKFFAREVLRAPLLSELSQLDDVAFRALFRKSAVKRIGRDRFVRNVLIAIGNSADGDLAVCAEQLLDDASPLVRGAAIWALGRLDRARLIHSAARHRAAETDPDVIEEWATACE